MMTYPVLHPPIPYADHHFTFNPHLRLSSQYHDWESSDQSIPPEKTSSRLLAARETDGLLRFLDEFDPSSNDQTHWNVKPEPVEQDVTWHGMDSSAQQHQHGSPSNTALYSPPPMNLAPNVSVVRRRSYPMRESDSSFRMSRHSSRTHNVGQGNTNRASQMNPIPSTQFAHLNLSDAPAMDYYTRRASLPSGSLIPHPYHTSYVSDLPLSRTKPLLSTPQKRLNHIMSEQKRRNAIRDGYAQLITLLAGPEGSHSALVMPTRGRPKGSGVKGKHAAKTGNDIEGAKGKSGVLFRAVEYCRWLEEGRDALKAEVEKVEAAAGILPQ
ncbi:putative HLH transcription factor [Lentinula raphanica]|nr:putative HLH transcription factor [Lentinula raphanica]